MRVIFKDYEIISEAKNSKIKIYENLENMKREFKNSLFVEVEGKIEEIPADGRWYVIGGKYVKIRHLTFTQINK